MKAIIIAAGSAKRLKNHTIILPKGLLDINGKSIVERQISIFRECGIEEIIVIIGPHKEKFKFKDVQYVFDSKFNEHDVLGSLMAARSFLNQDILISYSDILFDKAIIETTLQDSSDIGIAIDFNWIKSYEGRTEHPIEQADNVIVHEDKVLLIKKNVQFCENNQRLGEFVGLMRMSKKGCNIFLSKFNQLEKTHKGSFQDAPSFKKAYLTDMVQELIDQGIKITSITIKGKWCEIDTQQDLEKARKEFT